MTRAAKPLTAVKLLSCWAPAARARDRTGCWELRLALTLADVVLLVIFKSVCWSRNKTITLPAGAGSAVGTIGAAEAPAAPRPRTARLEINAMTPTR